MSHDDLPPPYYTVVSTLETEQRDVASHIRKLSQDIVNCDQLFYDIGVLFEGRYTVQVAPPSVADSWRKHKQTFKDIIWAARGAATNVQVRNTDFIDVILPALGNPSISRENKIKELKTFIARPLPKFLTSTESAEKIGEINVGITNGLKEYEESADKMVNSINAEIAKLEGERDKQKEQEKASQEKKATAPTPSGSGSAEYDSKIAEEKSKLETINKQRNDLKSKLADIRFALNTIPEQVGQCFLTTWTHLTNDATHLKNRMEGSTTDPLPDIAGVIRVYKTINDALEYYSTNVSNQH
ncbi:hypothetical protein BN14_10053 [Rhizoctonia solani AG-1 IB]|uniref:Uncharacterized protein n=1 Tax=Thanatephorus cucumeris (strain AG1-IB / isolate 7/3/14) TaxID=1108050 RepID=M5CGD6_THACB|nr:hypothetical protein BN14_10053 [Rhizoctonia solani AG-1 IB]